MIQAELFEPIAYPILFPHGETGWGKSFRVGKKADGSPCLKISFMDYLASRMLMPEWHRNDFFRNMEPTNEQFADPNFGKFGRMCTQIDTGRSFFNPSNRFERFSRLGQTFLVDQMSRAIDYRLSHVKKHQDHIFGGVARDNGIDDDSNDEEEGYGQQTHSTMRDIFAAGREDATSSASGGVRATGRGAAFSRPRHSHTAGFDGGLRAAGGGATSSSSSASRGRASGPTHLEPPEVYDPSSKPTFLGDNFCGSKRHLKKQAVNGLHIVSHFGPTHIFATLTCNKNWPEFKEVLWPDADVFDMPALVAEVFQARLQAFLHNL